MNKLLSSIVPAAVVVIASLGSAAAHASDASAISGAVAMAVQEAPTQHALTRQDVYNQLVQAEKDGTLARMNSLYYGTYWGWQDPNGSRANQ